MDWTMIVTNEALSNYFVFGAGLLVGVLVHLVRTLVPRPAIVQFEKQREISLIKLSHDAQERLKVTYQDEPIDDFQLTVFELRNKSRRTIEDIKLKLYLDEEGGPQKLYEISIEDPMEDLRVPEPTVACVTEESGEHFLAIRVPYLNNARDHKDILTVKIYSPKPVRVLKLVGGGNGWMTKFFDRVAFNSKLDGIVRESNSTMEFVLNTGIATVLRRWR